MSGYTSTGSSFDASRWAIVAQKDDAGMGRMAGDLKRVLGLGRHLVAPSERLEQKPLEPPGEVLLDPRCSEAELRSILADLQGIVFIERNSWHPALLRTCRALGVKTVCVPMWEWFRGWESAWKLCDLFVCPTRMTKRILALLGFRNTVHLPHTLDLRTFPARRVEGPARLFVHNTGLMDLDDRKGARDTIEAFKRVKRPDIRLVVRMQKPPKKHPAAVWPPDLPPLDERIELRTGNLPNPGDLYAEGDVAIQPSKMEGIGFMVLEPVCAGMPVVTLDYPPMNEFVQQREMRVAPQCLPRPAMPTRLRVWHAHLRIPSKADLARKIAWCADNDLTEISAQNRAWAERTFDRETLRKQWLEVLCALAEGRPSS